MEHVHLSDNTIRLIPKSRYERLKEIKKLHTSRIVYAYNENYTKQPDEERFEPIIVDEIDLSGDKLIPQLIDLLLEYSYNNRFIEMVQYKIAKPMAMEIGDVFIEFKSGIKLKLTYKDFFSSFIVEL